MDTFMNQNAILWKRIEGYELKINTIQNSNRVLQDQHTKLKQNLFSAVANGTHTHGQQQPYTTNTNPNYQQKIINLKQDIENKNQHNAILEQQILSLQNQNKRLEAFLQQAGSFIKTVHQNATATKATAAATTAAPHQNQTNQTQLTRTISHPTETGNDDNIEHDNIVVIDTENENETVNENENEQNDQSTEQQQRERERSFFLRHEYQLEQYKEQQRQLQRVCQQQSERVCQQQQQQQQQQLERERDH